MHFRFKFTLILDNAGRFSTTEIMWEISEFSKVFRQHVVLGSAVQSDVAVG